MKYVSSIIIFLLLVSFSYAQENCIAIQSGSAAKMVVELEQCGIKTLELDNVTEQANELMKQVVTYKESVVLYQQKEELYKGIIELQKMQIASAEEAMKNYREHITFVQKSYQELLKDTKPNPFTEFLKNILYLGAGVAAGSVLR